MHSIRLKQPVVQMFSRLTEEQDFYLDCHNEGELIPLDKAVDLIEAGAILDEYVEES